jgi:hypothetical protein
MNPITTPQPVATPIARMKTDTSRECELVRKRMNDGLSWAERVELLKLQRAARLAADAAYDASTESRSFPADRVNFHE